MYIQELLDKVVFSVGVIPILNTKPSFLFQYFICIFLCISQVSREREPIELTYWLQAETFNWLTQ